MNRPLRLQEETLCVSTITTAYGVLPYSGRFIAICRHTWRKIIRVHSIGNSIVVRLLHGMRWVLRWSVDEILYFWHHMGHLILDDYFDLNWSTQVGHPVHPFHHANTHAILYTIGSALTDCMTRAIGLLIFHMRQILFLHLKKSESTDMCRQCIPKPQYYYEAREGEWIGIHGDSVRVYTSNEVDLKQLNRKQVFQDWHVMLLPVQDTLTHNYTRLDWIHELSNKDLIKEQFEELLQMLNWCRLQPGLSHMPPRLHKLGARLGLKVREWVVD